MKILAPIQVAVVSGVGVGFAVAGVLLVLGRPDSAVSSGIRAGVIATAVVLGWVLMRAWWSGRSSPPDS